MGTKIVKTQTVIEREVEVCDRCEFIADNGPLCHLNRCYICGDDVCDKCGGWHEVWQKDEFVCTSCWDAGGDAALLQIGDAYERASAEIEAAIDAWRERAQELREEE